jgi:hypothetical protein
MVRLRAASVGPDRVIDFTTVGGAQQEPASSPEYLGWRRWGGIPNHVMWYYRGPYDPNLPGGYFQSDQTLVEGVPPILRITPNPPLTPGQYSIDIESMYTPDPPQARGSPNSEDFRINVSGDEKLVADPLPTAATEEAYWYHNIGDCFDSVACGEGNFVVADADGNGVADPVYLDLDADGQPDDLDGNGSPDDVAGQIVIIPRDWDNPLSWSGSLHLKTMKIREVNPAVQTAETLGWSAAK